MSLVLLDTHAWVWLLSGSERLGEKARALIQQSLDQGVVTISAISPWEVAMLVSKERLTLDRDVGEWVVTDDRLLLAYGDAGHLKTRRAGV